MRRLTALPLTLVLALGACASQPEEPPATTPPASSSPTSSAPATPLAPAAVDPALAVEVTGPADAKPEAKIATPLAVEKSARKVVTPGSGGEVTEGRTVVLDFTLYNGRDGKELQSTYGQTPANFPVTDQLVRGVASGLLGATVGDRLVIAVAPQDGFGANASQAYPDLKPEDTMVLVADLRRLVLDKAEGEAVTPPAGLPTVQTDDAGKVTGITVPDDAKKAPEALVVQPLIKGAGPAVTSGQNITVHYTGVRLEDGEKFDSSWDKGEPFPTAIGQGQVIKGWDEGLVGQTVGSRVLLVIPQALAYPDAQPGGQQPAGPLVFVVDILDAA